MFASTSVLDECVVVRPLKVPNRLNALTIAQRCAAQNGQYSLPMNSTSGLPFSVRAGPSTVAKKDPSALDTDVTALEVLAATNIWAGMVPPATLSVTLVGTPVTSLTTLESAVPVGPLLDCAAVPPPLFSFISTNAITTMTTTRMDPPAR